MSVQIIDIIFFAIVIFFAVCGLMKGFVDMVFNKLAPIASIWAAILFYKMLSSYLEPYISHTVARYVLSFFMIFAGFFIVVKVIQKVVGSIFKTVILNQLNRTLGFFMGIIEALAIIVLILIVLGIQPWFNVSGFLENSLFYSLFNSFTAYPLNTFSAPIVQDMPA